MLMLRFPKYLTHSVEINKKKNKTFLDSLFLFCGGWVLTGAILLCRTTTFGWNFNISTITWASAFPGAKSNIWSILMNQLNFGWFKQDLRILQKYLQTILKIQSRFQVFNSCENLVFWLDELSSTNQRQVLFCVNQWETSIALCQPIRDKYCSVSTNQRQVLFCVNQSETWMMLDELASFLILWIFCQTWSWTRCWDCWVRLTENYLSERCRNALANVFRFGSFYK